MRKIMAITMITMTIMNTMNTMMMERPPQWGSMPYLLDNILPARSLQRSQGKSASRRKT